MVYSRKIRKLKPLKNITLIIESNNLSTLDYVLAGTRYNYSLKINNDLNTNYSENSATRLSDRLRLPNDNGTSNTTITLTRTTTNSVTTPTSTSNLNNATVSYIQTSGGSGAFTGSFNIDNSIQTIQITKPWTSSQQNTTTGYGKWIDNSQNLVKIECYINDQLKQYITYHGFNTTSNNIGTQ